MSVHLLVLVHGMWGSPTDLAELARIIKETYQAPQPQDDTELHVLVAQTNSDDSTYDGIDWGGERVAQEVDEEVKKIQSKGKKVTKFSITGYSLGGLLSRYVIGILHQRNFFQHVAPVNFNTFATPHIGLPRYPSIISSIFSSLGPRLLSRTGEQFYCVDKWSESGRPLLDVMADPERIFYQSLALFPYKRIYANAVNDRTVPYVTAAIEAFDPFMDHETNGLEIHLDGAYSPIIESYALPPNPPSPKPRPPVLTLQWFKSLKPSRPFLPPFLQFRFPFNIVLYLLLPILIPTFIIFALIRFSLASRSSRARIKLLEKGNKDKLIHIVQALEKQMADTVVELIDDPDDLTPNSSSPPSVSGSRPSTPPIAPKPKPKGRPRRRSIAVSLSARDIKPQQPNLTPLQLKIIEQLNSLDGLEKEMAFIHPVANSHAAVVSRNVKRFKAHKIGEGVIKHWANVFVL